MVDLKVKYHPISGLEEQPKLHYKREGDAGFDLYAAEDSTIRKGAVKVVPTTVSLEIPPGYEVQIRSRSGLASKGVMVANSPGTIDSGYRGLIEIILFNAAGFGPYYSVKAGDRIAQGVMKKCDEANFITVDELTESERGSQGFGSTGR